MPNADMVFLFLIHREMGNRVIGYMYKLLKLLIKKQDLYPNLLECQNLQILRTEMIFNCN
jgi:hypothetical protein